LARCLLRLAGAFGKPDGAGILLDIKLSQQQLGSLIGVSRESINKQLRAWESRNWVRLEHGAIVVLDPESLQALAEAGSGNEGD